MLVRLTEAEFDQHLAQGFDNADSDRAFTRLGVQVNQWDNGMGCGLLMLTEYMTDKVRFLHYQ